MKSLKAKFRKTDVNEWNKNDERLLAAVEHGEAEKVASLLSKKGASAVKLDNDGKSALHVAAARGQTDCLSVLLAHGVDLSITDAAGFNPLHLAAKNDHIECCRKLIQSKSPVDATDASGRTALHHAAAGGNVHIVQLLCELKSPVDLKDADGLAPLLCAAKHGHADACAALLDYDADVNAPDNVGRTALMLACESNAAAAVEVLVQRGADLSALDSQGHDVGHFAKLSGSPEIKNALNRLILDPKSPRSPQHDQVAKLSDERITTPKKRKAPPPPISPQQSSGPASPSVVSTTPSSSKNDTPKFFNYKDDEVGGAELRGEVEQRDVLLEVSDDPRTASLPQPELKVEHGLSASAALVSALQAKITALTLENQQLCDKLKKHPTGNEDPRESSRPNSMTSNASFHSTQDEFDVCAGDKDDASDRREGGGGKEEVRLLRQALESVQLKLLETRKENRSLQSQLKPERDEYERVREKGREEELMESLAELQAKLTDTQERYHQAVEEVEELRGQVGREGGERTENQDVQRLEQEVGQLKAQLVRSGSEQEEAARRMRDLEEALGRAEEERRRVVEEKQKEAEIEELYKEAQEEIKMLQEALRGTVPVDAAARDFEDMKAELNEVISGLQRRLLELSHSYSETKSELSVAQKQLVEAPPPPSEEEERVQELQDEAEQLRRLLAEAEKKNVDARAEILLLKQEAESQAQSTVALSDHMQVMSSLGNAIKELESQTEKLKEELQQKTLQVEALQDRLAAASDVRPADTVSRSEHESVREQLEAEVSRLTQLLQGALRKQDEMALEAAEAWQKARESGAEREALQELATSREEENQTLSSRLAEAQDGVSQLKQLVENHVASEREKNKRIDDLSREVGKLKDALNSLSQLSYSSGSPSKRQQQSQQLDTMQQQIKQLQYQLTETKKQHHEIISVYRMHLLYAVQGQMDEDVQKALKQILMMCKMSAPPKDAC
ncbi:ankycorbin isoform X1 [Takifugu flavidus]|uniref:ankycorbin isoform X1 n=1 Tax=Takifugu flavidus TaxID=433684 RepID=UPI0025441488|nr:ankycorbin isoform X1 [Takifugu flavidus]